MSGDVQEIPLGLVDRPGNVLRDVIDPDGVRELAESIREVGLIEPIIVRRRGERYEVVAGDRRFLAHRLLRAETIRAVVRDMDDAEVSVVRAVENLQRVGLTPSEEGRVYLDLHDSLGIGYKEVARRCGKSENTVLRYVNVARQSEEVRRGVDEGRVALRVLEILQGIDDEEMFLYYFRMARDNGVSAHVAQLWVSDYQKTLAGTYYVDGGGMSPKQYPVEVKPVYVTCDVCHAAVEVNKVRTLAVCAGCASQATRLRAVDGSSACTG